MSRWSSDIAMLQRPWSICSRVENQKIKSDTKKQRCCFWPLVLPAEKSNFCLSGSRTYVYINDRPKLKSLEISNRKNLLCCEMWDFIRQSNKTCIYFQLRRFRRFKQIFQACKKRWVHLNPLILMGSQCMLAGWLQCMVGGRYVCLVQILVWSQQ